MAGAKRVENRVDEIEEKLAAMQADIRELRSDFQRIDMEKLQSGVNKIPDLEESILALVKKLDIITKRPDEETPEASGSGKDKEPRTQMPDGFPPSVPSMNLMPRQLELPVFEGVNPEGWLFRAERYFELNNLSPTEKIRSAVICLEGEALSWYYYEDSRRPFCSWEDFRKQLIERFQSTQEGALQDQLFSLQQITTVQEYRRQFEVLSASLSDLSESTLEIVFRKGLQPDIRAELRLMDPMGLPRMMRMAQQIEDKNIAIQLNQRRNDFSKEQAIPSGTNFSRNVTRQLSAVSSTSPIQPYAKTTATSKFRRLSETEMQEKREKGLCFRCDEKYGPGHRCKKKELQVLWMHEDELEVNESYENYEENIT